MVCFGVVLVLNMGIQMRDGPPNILFIMSDQQRWDSLGCYGADWVKTPALDALALEGVVHERCYCNNPICTPSRASLMTGKELPGHGVFRLFDNLPTNEVMFTERLRKLGYETALFGKLHVSGRLTEEKERHPHDGFDTYEWCIEPMVSLDSPFNGYRRWLERHDPAFLGRLRKLGRSRGHDPAAAHMTRWAADRTIDFLSSRRDSAAPFFCMMSVFDPHNPYNNYPVEARNSVDAALIPRPTPAAWKDHSGSGSPPAPLLAEHEDSYLGRIVDMDASDIEAMRVGYFAAVGFLDEQVGRVLDALARSGHAEDTLVVFTSDHGDMLGDQELLVKGAMLYEPVVRVPLIVRYPSVGSRFSGTAGTRDRRPVQLNDLAATFLRCAGAVPADVAAWMPDAIPLQPVAVESQHRRYAVTAYRNSGICRDGGYWNPPILSTMITDGRHKVVAYGEDAWQLFDLDEDPLEQRNLWDSSGIALKKGEFTSALIDWMSVQQLRGAGRGGEALPDLSQQIRNTL